MFVDDFEASIRDGIKLPEFYHPDTSAGKILLHYLQRSSAIVQVNADDGVEMTAAEIAKLGLRVAKNLRKNGLSVGDVVTLVAGHSSYVAAIVLGCLLAGNSINALDPAFDSHEIVKFFWQTPPKLVLCDAVKWQVVNDMLMTCGNDSEVLTIDVKLDDVRFVSEMFELRDGEKEFM